MNYTQLEHLALQVRNHNGGAYRAKSLCKACLMKKARITSPHDQMEFGKVWRKWVVKQGTCLVCGHAKEIMTLPAT